jgi:hypothetical protein
MSSVKSIDVADEVSSPIEFEEEVSVEDSLKGGRSGSRAEDDNAKSY